MYIYKDRTAKIIYVGKAKNLRSRVSSYFQPPTKLGPKTADLVSHIVTIEYIEVGSETEALLLESRLIKKFKPFFNIISKDDKSPYYIHITREEYPRPVINHLSAGSVAGPFLNSLVPRTVLRHFRKIAPYCLAQRPVKHPCFYSHLGLCDPCPAFGLRKEYIRHISYLKKLLSGNFSSVRKSLAMEMLTVSKKQDFEQAAKIRDQITAMDFLLSRPVLPEEYLINPNLVADRRQSALDSLMAMLKNYYPNINSLFRIEVYDIAHLSGTSAAGSMVVAVNGQSNSNQYRHFTIKTSPGNSDVDSMKEILSRRLARTDWQLPDLIVLDGGVPQLSAILSLTGIPLISLAKQRETIIIPKSGNYHEINLDRSDPGLQLLQSMRDEAHRFSRRLHHRHRSQSLLQ